MPCYLHWNFLAFFLGLVSVAGPALCDIVRDAPLDQHLLEQRGHQVGGSLLDGDRAQVEHHGLVRGHALGQGGGLAVVGGLPVPGPGDLLGLEGDVLAGGLHLRLAELRVRGPLLHLALEPRMSPRDGSRGGGGRGLLRAVSRLGTPRGRQRGPREEEDQEESALLEREAREI